MTIRRNLKLGRLAAKNEAPRVRTALAAGVISTLCLALPAQAQPKVAVVDYACNIEGAQGQLTARVQAVNGAGVFIDPTGRFAGSIRTGDVNFFYEGSLISAGGRYSFTGTNQFAEFVDLITNDRFRVQMIPEGTQLLLIINPQGPGPVRYMCQQRGAAGRVGTQGNAATQRTPTQLGR